jgi:hypothetical protein
MCSKPVGCPRRTMIWTCAVMSVDGMFVYWWKAFGVHVLALVGNSFCCVMLPLCEDSSLLIGYRWVVRMVGGKKRGRKGNCFGHIRFCAWYRRSLKYNERRCFIKVDSSLLPFLCLFFPSSPLFFSFCWLWHRTTDGSHSIQHSWTTNAG